MRTLHLVGLPHTETTPAYATCAYTQKIRKFAKMMTALGERVVLYGGEENDAPVAEHVVVVSKEERVEWFGENDPNALPTITWNPAERPWLTMNARTAAEIAVRAEPHDLVLLIAGLAQKPIADALPALISCEWGIGYEGVFSPYRAYESYAWMHHIYAKQGINDGRWYDAVIPNYFDPEEFPYMNDGNGDYLLFLGRLVARKGPHIAAQIAKEAGMRLVVAGAGAIRVEPGAIIAEEVSILGDHVEYAGAVGIEERAMLLAGARALVVPTTYVEPFGGVAVEAMMAGTPVIATDWGAFTETIATGISGYHFRTLAEGIDAVERVEKLIPEFICSYARDRYALAAVGPQFSRWFDRLETLWGEGWNTLPEKHVVLAAA